MIFILKNLHNKKEYIIHMRNLKQALTLELLLTKLHRAIKFNQEILSKSYIDINLKLRKYDKLEFEKKSFKLMNNAVFSKTMGNVRKHRDIKLVTTEARKNYLLLEPNYQTIKLFLVIHQQ